MTKEVFNVVSTRLWGDSTLNYQVNYINPRLTWSNSEIYTELLILVNTLRIVQTGTLDTIIVAIAQSSPSYHHDANTRVAEYGRSKTPHGSQAWPAIEGNDGVSVGLCTTIPGCGSTEYSAFACPKQTDMRPQSQNFQYYLAQPYITLPLDRRFLPYGYRALPEDRGVCQPGMD